MERVEYFFNENMIFHIFVDVTEIEIGDIEGKKREIEDLIAFVLDNIVIKKN